MRRRSCPRLETKGTRVVSGVGISPGVRKQRATSLTSQQPSCPPPDIQAARFSPPVWSGVEGVELSALFEISVQLFGIPCFENAEEMVYAPTDAALLHTPQTQNEHTHKSRTASSVSDALNFVDRREPGESRINPETENNGLPKLSQVSIRLWAYGTYAVVS